MLLGYFSVETPLYGVGAAIAELSTINILQVTFGAIISLILIQVVQKAYPAIMAYKPQPVSTKYAVAVVVVVVIVLSAIVGFYVTQGIG
jgi:hypothetical protein